MKLRCGQVALYLVLVLVAIAVLMLMNVNAYLAVTAKNRAMNAADAASLAVAGYQGELLGQIGSLNVQHLKVLMPRYVTDGSEPRSREERLREAAELVRRQQHLAFIGPLHGITLGNNAAAAKGAIENNEMRSIFTDHISDIRSVYMTTPDLYPEPWEGAWEEYAEELETELSQGMTAGPDNADFRNGYGASYLTGKSFYTAIAGRSWCWFYFNARSLIENYTNYRDWGPLPDGTLPASVNCEIYPLGVKLKQSSALDVFANDITLIEELTDMKVNPVKPSGEPPPPLEESLLGVLTEQWMMYDDDEDGRYWREWWEIDPDGAWKFPVVGKVKSEYNLRGAGAVCRVYVDYTDLLASKEDEVKFTRESVFTSGAKPFGYIEANGRENVLYHHSVVTPVDWQTRLVPVDTIGGKDLSTADATWTKHVREHLPLYLENGPGALGGCWYCQQLRTWEDESIRAVGRNAVKTGATDCQRSGGTSTERGGTPHGH